MGIEIERKFRIHGEAWRRNAVRPQRITQGYINDAAVVESGAQHASVRVRRSGDQAWLNLKSRDVGPARQEFEYEIPLDDAEALLALCVGGVIDKTRHHVIVGAHLWEVDEFHGENAGLVVAEIELDAVDELFERPDWAGPEVTGETRYYNLALASRPFAKWTDEEKSC